MAKSNRPSFKDKVAYLGCGEFPMAGAVNVDVRALPGVDVVADVKKLPFKDGELQGIGSRNLIEHFGRHEIQDLVKEWARCVKKEGFVHVETVDMGKTMTKWKDIPEENLMDCLFGAQTYPENFHKMLMTEDILTRLFSEAGMTVGKVEQFEHREIPRIKMLFVKI